MAGLHYLTRSDHARNAAREAGLTVTNCTLKAWLDGTTTIDRREWGLVYNQRLEAGGTMVSEKVRLQFDISAI